MPYMTIKIVATMECNGLTWACLESPELLGYLPDFLSVHDPRPAKEQFDENYQHGGGWLPFSDKWKLHKDGAFLALEYPGDPMFRIVAMTRLRDEIILIFQHDLVCILQPDNSFEVARMD